MRLGYPWNRIDPCRSPEGGEVVDVRGTDRGGSAVEGLGRSRKPPGSRRSACGSGAGARSGERPERVTGLGRLHRPTVKCQQERTQGLNRYLARVRLADKLEAKIKGAESAEQQRIEKLRRQNEKEANVQKRRCSGKNTFTQGSRPPVKDLQKNDIMLTTS